MHLRRALLALVAVLAGAVAAPVRAADPTPEDLAAKALERAIEIEDELVGTLERVRRASVSVLNLRRVKKDDPESPTMLGGVGSGTIVAQKGLWVLTNVHVVQGADDLRIVALDGSSHAMAVADKIEKYDIALLSFVGAPPRGFKGVPIKANPSVAEGTWVVATGNPFFLANDGQSVATLGVVSGLDRILGGQFLYGKAIQHDAEVNPGNSGGPLWNLKGDFIGINGMIASTPSAGSGPHNTGASFSIPAEQVSRFLAAMIDKKTDAQAGTLGLEFETHMDEEGNPDGAAVTKADARVTGPKGLQVGDVIVRVTPARGGSTSIRTASDLTNFMSMMPAGTAVKVAYRRGKSTATWSGKLGGQ